MDKTQPAAKDIYKVRLNYYNKIRVQVENIVGHGTRELNRYHQVYENELNLCQYKEVTSQYFFKSIQNSQILLVGDFHAQTQSTRSLLRICRKLGAEKIVLVLECFRSKDQKYINHYLNGDITEQEFLKSIQWSKNWNFPWEQTKALMKWAITHSVPVFGMNLNLKSVTLAKRDQHFSKIIHQTQKNCKNKIIVTQVGDFHLSKKHLPAELKKIDKKISIQTVYQSPDVLYFKSLKKNSHNQSQLLKSSDFLELNPGVWALMTVVPWVKWQDYLFLESGMDRSISAHDRKHETDDLDMTDHVDRFIKLISESLNLKVDTQNLSVYSGQDPQLKKILNKLNPDIRSKVRLRVESGQSFYIPEIQVGILNRLTVNHISRLASQYILYKVGVFQNFIIEGKSTFIQMIWIEMLTYFMTKIANPKRKTDTLMDIRTALNNSSFGDKGKDVLALSLEQKMKEIQFINTAQIAKNKISRQINSQSYAAASTILGGILGEKIFFAFNKKIIKFPEINNFLFKTVHHKEFEIRYFESIEIIDSWPLPFKSKFDQF